MAEGGERGEVDFVGVEEMRDGEGSGHGFEHLVLDRGQGLPGFGLRFVRRGGGGGGLGRRWGTWSWGWVCVCVSSGCISMDIVFHHSAVFSGAGDVLNVDVEFLE